ncbi:MAG: thiolase domain-containing protein [Candidatus Syntropharchaeia archaeon]
MRDVAVIGVGHTKYGTHNDKGLKELFVEAFIEAVNDVDKGIDPKEIKEVYIGNMGIGGAQLGNLSALMVEQVGIPYTSVRKEENACASSGFAFRDAYIAIKSGLFDIVLAGGVEKMQDLTRDMRTYWLGSSGDVEWERLAGVTFAGVYAMMAIRHMKEYGTKKEQMTMCAVKNHRNAAKNPKAQFQREITLEQAMNSPMVAYPFTIFDCCGTTDGASAVILASGEIAKKYTDTPIWVTGSGGGSDYLALHDRESITRIDAAIKAAREAYKRARREPKEMDLAEVHDCFTIAEILAYEALGFCEMGEGGKLIEEGETEIGGKIPVNPSGGLKAKGHPIGATGTGQVYEIVKQLRGEAERKERQVEGAEIGIAHNVGGSGGSAAVHILER